MNFFRIGMTTTDRPTDAQVAAVLQDRERPGEPARVRALRGRTPPHRHDDRSYRMTYDGWTPAQAYSEMKQYRFEGFPDHPVLRSYVYAYPSGACHAAADGFCDDCSRHDDDRKPARNRMLACL